MHVMMLVASLALASTDAESPALTAALQPLPSSTPFALAEADTDAEEEKDKDDKSPIFPLWNKPIREKGFTLPPAAGLMVNYYYQKSAILISDLQIGVNNGELYDASFIKFDDAEAHASALAIRPSFMLLPFLSFYTVISSGSSETEVNISEPTTFSTVATSGAFVVSLGATGQFGYKGFFVVADFNGSLADVERIADLMGSNLLSFRGGYNYKLKRPEQSVSLWAGTAGQVIGLETKGSVQLAEVIPAPDQAKIDEINAKCDEYRKIDPRKEACESFAGSLQDWADGTAPPDSSVQYALNKEPKDIWNMLVGAQFALNRNWYFRSEVGFLGSRTSFLVGTEYKFDI
jgi:hypothetical protein